MDIGKTVPVIPGRTLRYADPRGPHYPQLVCFKGRKVECPVGLVKTVKELDPEAEWVKIPEDKEEVKNKEDKGEIQNKEDKEENEIPEDNKEGEDKGDTGKRKKTKFLKGK